MCPCKGLLEFYLLRLSSRTAAQIEFDVRPEGRASCSSIISISRIFLWVPSKTAQFQRLIWLGFRIRMQSRDSPSLALGDIDSSQSRSKALWSVDSQQICDHYEVLILCLACPTTVGTSATTALTKTWKA